jgi:hypothetical protein
MIKVLVVMNNSIHIDNGIVNKDRVVYGYLRHLPRLTRSVKILDEDGQPILTTTLVVSTRFRNIPSRWDQNKKLNLKDNSVIFQTMNTEYEIFYNQNFEKSKIVE